MLTVGQVAERLNVSLGTIYAACQSGRLRHYRIGRGRGAIRITEEDLQLFVESGSKASTN